MKIKKTVTQAVLNANRANATCSTGPVSVNGKKAVSQNARRHGLLSNKVVLNTPKKKAEYGRLLEAWTAQFHPEGALQTYLVENVATTTWKLGIVEDLEAEALLRRESSADCVTHIFTNDLKLPLDANDVPLDRSWDCEKLVIRAIAGEQHANSSGSRQPLLFNGQPLKGTQSNGNHEKSDREYLEFEAVLGDAMDRLTRYRARLMKDFYKAIEILRSLRTEDKRRLGTYKD